MTYGSVPESMKNPDLSLQKCQQIIGYQFSDPSLLAKALTHASAASQPIESNERLEFLGDSILGSIICRELFDRFPGYLEGELTKIKSMIVSRRTCAQIADQIGLSEYLQVGKGMSNHRKLPSSCRAATLESIIGAIYVDGGDKPVRKFVLRHFQPLLDRADADQHQGNFKSMLQQYSQSTMETTPVYELLDEKGPDHSKCFEVGVIIGSRRFASGWGPSKKEAEQLAAFRALQELEIIAAEAEFPHAIIS